MLLTEKYNDVERYALSQVWMMKDGTAMLILGIDPISKLRSSNKERNVRGKKVTLRSQNNALSDKLVIFTDPASDIAYQIDLDSNISMSIKDMRNNEAGYLFSLTVSFMEKVNRQLADHNSNNW